MTLSFIQAAATSLLVFQVCSIVSAQPVQAQSSRQAESLARDTARLAAKIRRNVKAAKLQSQLLLAGLLALGQGVRKDEAQAEQWLKKPNMVV